MKSMKNEQSAVEKPRPPQPAAARRPPVTPSPVAPPQVAPTRPTATTAATISWETFLWLRYFG